MTEENEINALDQNTEQKSNEEEAPPSLEELASFFTDQIGPDKAAIERFLWKETDKLELVNLRLNELLILLEGVVTTQQFGNPKETASHLQDIFSSIDAICSFVYDIKNRLIQLEKEVDRRKPNKIIGFMKKMTRRNEQPLDLDTVLFEADKLLAQYGISFPEQNPKPSSENQEEKNPENQEEKKPENQEEKPEANQGN